MISCRGFTIKLNGELDYEVQNWNHPLSTNHHPFSQPTTTMSQNVNVSAIIFIRPLPGIVAPLLFWWNNQFDKYLSFCWQCSWRGTDTCILRGGECIRRWWNNQWYIKAEYVRNRQIFHPVFSRNATKEALSEGIHFNNSWNSKMIINSLSRNDVLSIMYCVQFNAGCASPTPFFMKPNK